MKRTKSNQEESLSMEQLLSRINIEDIKVFEEEVDQEMQIEFSEHLLNRRKSEKEDLDSHLKLLFSDTTGIDKKKDLIIGLLSTDEVSAYRGLENFLETLQQGDLRKWTKLAMHEMTMRFQTMFSGKTKMSITCGMGGKGNKLRYFCILGSRIREELNEFRHDLVNKEIEFVFKNNNSELEEITFEKRYISFTCLIPLNISIKSLVEQIIDTSNEFGNFLSSKCLLTNVKKLENEEIDDFINKLRSRRPKNY